MQESKRSVLRTIVSVIGGVLTAIVALVSGWITYSAALIDHRLPLPPALAADRRSFHSQRAGEVSYYVDRSGHGRPLVLIHSINAASSAYEMRPLFEQYRGQRPVYAPDLPGFGFSERSDRAYDPALYAQAIIDLIDGHVDEPDAPDVIAFSLSSEFAARAALQRPDLIHTLTLISPTGLQGGDQMNRIQQWQERGTSDRVLAFLRFPLWSQALYDLIVSPPSLRYFLQQAFVGEVAPDWLAYTYPTTHQPGARYAPFAFLSGKLFSSAIRDEVYEQLRLPVLVLYDQNVNVTFDALPELVARNPHWRGQRIVPTLGAPHWEKRAETIDAVERFWQEAQSSVPA